MQLLDRQIAPHLAEEAAVCVDVGGSHRAIGSRRLARPVPSFTHQRRMPHLGLEAQKLHTNYTLYGDEGVGNNDT